MSGWGGGVWREGEAHRVGIDAAGGGREDEVAEGELLYLCEAGAGDEQGAVAGVEFDAGDVRGLGEGAGGEIVGFGLAVLLDGEVKVAGSGGVLQREGEFEEVGVVGGG